MHSTLKPVMHSIQLSTQMLRSAVQQAHGDNHRMVFLGLLFGLTSISDLEELQQGLSRGPLPGHVCLCHHCQHLLWPGHHSEGLLLGSGVVQCPLAAGKPWHRLFGPCHLYSGQEACSVQGCFCVHHLGMLGLQPSIEVLHAVALK